MDGCQHTRGSALQSHLYVGYNSILFQNHQADNYMESAMSTLFRGRSDEAQKLANEGPFLRQGFRPPL